jgi:hypothetical protein
MDKVTGAGEGLCNTYIYTKLDKIPDSQIIKPKKNGYIHLTESKCSYHP